MTAAIKLPELEVLEALNDPNVSSLHHADCNISGQSSYSLSDNNSVKTLSPIKSKKGI